MTLSHPDDHAFLERGTALECLTLAAFLKTLSYSTPVLLTPIDRRLPAPTGLWHAQFAVHVTARKGERESLISYGTFLAAQVLGSGTAGSFSAPYHQEHHPDALATARRFTAELSACLLARLQQDPRVSEILTPARYRLPDAWIWHCGSLAEEGIVCQDQHWQILPAQAQPATQAHAPRSNKEVRA